MGLTADRRASVRARRSPGAAWGMATAALLALAACGGGGGGADGGARGDERGRGEGGRREGGRGEGRAPPVVVGEARIVEVQDRLEAVGSAFANEQADLNSTVTERVERVNFRDGVFVRRGQVIAQLRQSEQSAQLSANRARLVEAEQQLERLEALLARGFATRAQIDAQRADVLSLRSQGAAVESQIGDRVIRAPFDGWLSLRRISPGTVVSAGTTIATIVDFSSIRLDFPVPEVHLGTVQTGDRIEATAAAFPGVRFTGRISSIEPFVDPVTRSATVRADLPNRDLRLRPGMLLTVEIVAAPRRALVVPELAIVGQGDQSFVYGVGPDNVARRVAVRTGQRREGLVEIASGLQPGIPIIVEGTVRARDGGSVRPVPAGTPAARGHADAPRAGGAA